MANLRLHSLNDVKLVGRLTKDPDLRFTSQGTPVCHFRLAVGRRFKDRNSGEWREDVAFVPCSVWRESAERCGQRLKKGSPVFVDGRLRSRDWQTKDGQKRSDLEVDVNRIQFLESAGEGVETEPIEGEHLSQGAPVAVAAESPTIEEAGSHSSTADNDVPF